MQGPTAELGIRDFTEWAMGSYSGLRPGECHALIISLKVVPGTDKE